MSSPLVSVVVGAYQVAGSLRRSLATVLDQDLRDLELIVVDDGSTDATTSILADLAAADDRVVILRQENGGLTSALSRGCAAARGEFVARHDADDLSLPGRLSAQVEALVRDRSLSFVSCWAQALGPEDEPLYDIHRPSEPAMATGALLEGRDGPPGHGSVMMRTDCYRRAGGYRSAFRYAQDWDLWLRLAEQGQLSYVPRTLYAYRVDEASISARRRSQQLRLMRLALECRAARVGGRPEEPWLSKAEEVSREPPPARGSSDPGNSYFIGKCLLDRRDRRCRPYLRRAVRDRPTNWRAWGALALSAFLARTRDPGPEP
jgi:glycosyltransferase involved in cell wall biosynthesis